MIELTFSTAFMLYLCMTLAAVLGVWIYSHRLDREKKILSCEQELCICEYCHNTYLEDVVSKVNQCPQCGLFNKHNQFTQSRSKQKDE